MSDKTSWQFLDDLKHRKEKPKEEKVGQIEGLAPQFWEQAPPLKNGQFRGQKHLEYVPEFCTASEHIQNLHFAKKNGPNRPIQPSAVVRIIYCRLYGVPTTN